MTSKQIWRSSTVDVFQRDHCVLPWTKQLNSPILIADDKWTQECKDFACPDQVIASHKAITMFHAANCVATHVINHWRACQKYNSSNGLSYNIQYQNTYTPIAMERNNLVNKVQQDEHIYSMCKNPLKKLIEILWKYRVPQYHETNYTRRGTNWCVSTRVRCNVPYLL